MQHGGVQIGSGIFREQSEDETTEQIPQEMKC